MDILKVTSAQEPDKNLDLLFRHDSRVTISELCSHPWLNNDITKKKNYYKNYHIETTIFWFCLFLYRIL